MKAYELKPDAKGLDDLIAVERPEPKAGAGEVVIRVRAASLNARDQGVAAGRYRGGAVTKPTIPLSDGAGEVIAVGPGVTRVKLGDRVMHTFRKNWIDGPYHPDHIGETMGLPLDGMLAEQVLANEADCVRVPDHLSDEEAACLPCAGVTAWHALMEKKALRPGETVLLIGTGGVAIFGLQFAKLAGAPQAPAAGIDLHVRNGDFVERGEPLFTLHAESPGELAYALQYAEAQSGTIHIAEDA